jgi:CRP-like cAMP-binding protein
MLTIFEIPQYISDLYAESKSIAGDFFTFYQNEPEVIVPHNSDLYQLYTSGIILVKAGFLKSYCDKKLIRLYSAGDIITIPEKTDIHYSIKSELALRIIHIPYTIFIQQLILSQNKLLEKWLRFKEIEQRLVSGLCSVYLREDFNPKIDIRNFQAGELIIQEGSAPDSLYEMLSGEALVTVQNTEVGRIQRGEIFGEISFLTQSTRTASVKTLTPCTVQIIKGENFDTIATCRPALIKSIARTTAKRLIDVNKRLVRISIT